MDSVLRRAGQNSQLEETLQGFIRKWLENCPLYKMQDMASQKRGWKASKMERRGKEKHRDVRKLGSGRLWSPPGQEPCVSCALLHLTCTIRKTKQIKQEMKEPYWKNADSSVGSENKMYGDTLLKSVYKKKEKMVNRMYCYGICVSTWKHQRATENFFKWL